MQASTSRSVSLRHDSSCRATCSPAVHQRLRGSRCVPRHVVRALPEVSESSFDTEVLQASTKTTILTDFWAPWCGPCKLITPLLEAAEKEHNGALKVVKIEHGPNPKLIEQYKVYGLPTLILFRDGKMVEGSKREGAISKQVLAEYLKKFSVSGVPAS